MSGPSKAGVVLGTSTLSTASAAASGSKLWLYISLGVTAACSLMIIVFAVTAKRIERS